MNPDQPADTPDPLPTGQPSPAVSYGILGFLARAFAVLLLLLAALGWVITHAGPLRWVVDRVIEPIASLAGHSTLDLSVQDANWTWVTFGPSRLAEGVRFQRGQVGINLFSPAFGQSVLWGADITVAETAEGWRLDQPDADAQPLAGDDDASPSATAVERAPVSAPFVITLIDSHLRAKALPVAEGADGPVVAATIAFAQAQGPFYSVLVGSAQALAPIHGKIEAQATTSAAAAFGLDPAFVSQDSAVSLAVSGEWWWQDQQIVLPAPVMSVAVGRGFTVSGLHLVDDFLLTAQVLPGDTDDPDPMLRILLPEESGAAAITTILPHLRVLSEPVRLRSDGDEVINAEALSVAVNGIFTLGEQAPTVVRELKTTFENAALTLMGASLDTLSITLDIEADQPRIIATAQVSHLPLAAAPEHAPSGNIYPLRLTFDAAPSEGAEEALLPTAFDFHLRVDSAKGAALLTASGRHSLADGAGQAQLRLLPQTFVAGGLQPEHILPMLGGTVSESSGRVSGLGSVRWQGDQVTPDLTLAFDKVSLRHGFLFLEQMTGVMRLDRFWPPRTPKGQQIAIAHIQAGLPLSNALATFHLDGKGKLVIEKAELALARGTLALGESSVQLSPLSGHLLFTVKDVDLGALAAYGQLDGLTASGTLSGSIPVILTDSDVLIEQGKLSADQIGFVRYRPEETPSALQTGGSVDLLLQALDDFQYQGLDITVNGSASGELEAGLHLKGANPGLYDGFPVELNLSLSGALSQLVASTVESTSVPERIQKRVSEIMAAPSQ